MANTVRHDLRGQAMRLQDPEIFQLHAEFCQVLANRKRLMILSLLAKREMSVGEIVDALGSRLSNVSQHMQVLRNHNMVNRRREAQTVYYSLADPRLIHACRLMREILLDDLKRRGVIASEVGVEELVPE